MPTDMPQDAASGSGEADGTTPPPSSPSGVTPPPSPGGAGATPPPSPTPAGASAGGSGQPPGNNGDFVPRSRLNEVTTQARALLAERDAEIARLRQSAAPRPPADPEADAIKEQFFRLFPAAKQLFELPEGAIAKLLEAAPQFEAQTEHYWSNVGQAVLRQLEGSMVKAFGGAPDPRTRRWLETSFIDWVGNDADAKARYISQDPTLVEDFWKMVNTHMFDPIRRAALTSEQRRGERRSRLPVPGPGGAPASAKPPLPKDEDELHEQAWAAFQGGGRG